MYEYLDRSYPLLKFRKTVKNRMRRLKEPI